FNGCGPLGFFAACFGCGLAFATGGVAAGVVVVVVGFDGSRTTNPITSSVPPGSPASLRARRTDRPAMRAVPDLVGRATAARTLPSLGSDSDPLRGTD